MTSPSNTSNDSGLITPPTFVALGMMPCPGQPDAPYFDGTDVTEFLPQFRQMATEAGRDPARIPVTIFGAQDHLDRLKRYRDQGIARAVVSLPSADADQILPTLDRWAGLIRQTAP